MMIKANRTPHHQPEGNPGYADHPESNPASAGFFFSSRSGQQRDHLDLGDAAYMLLQAAKRWCRVRDLNSRPTVYKTAALPLS
jgi:hypothetical protein